VGDFEYLSDEFPALFPRAGGEKGRVDTRSHVPTLVLHGQRGFNLERWSSARATRSRRSTESETKEAEAAIADKTGGATAVRSGEGEHPSSRGSFDQTISLSVRARNLELRGAGTADISEEATDEAEEVMCIRGGGSSQELTHDNPLAENKRPCLTFEGRALRLPRTPKRLKKAKVKKKMQSQENNVESSRGGNANVGKKVATGGNSASEIIVIDSDSEDEPEQKRMVDSAAEVIVIDDDSGDEPEQKRTAKRTTTMASATLTATKMPPATSRPTVATKSTAAAKNSLPNTSASSPRAGSPEGANARGPGEFAPRKDAPPPPEPTARDTSSSSFPGERRATYDGGNDSSQDSKESLDASKAVRVDRQASAEDEKANYKRTPLCGENRPKAGWGGVKPVSVFGGEVYFTQVLPRWRPPSASKRKKRRANGEATDTAREPTVETDKVTAAEYSDDEDGEAQRRSLREEYEQHTSAMNLAKDEDTKTVQWGVHHPKFFLLFERSGSLVVVVSTSNLTPQTSTEGSWVQRFEPADGGDDVDVDHGMPSDFGVVLADFLRRQSDAAAGGMLPDVFLRRHVPGLSSGLGGLADRYRFDDAQVHLVSTVPGDHVGGLPRGGFRLGATFHPCVAYGPQRVSFVLSRTLDERHIHRSKDARRAAAAARTTTGRDSGGGERPMEKDLPWLPRLLVAAEDRLVLQPTSLGGNWTREDLEGIVRSYSQPRRESGLENDGGAAAHDSGLELMDIVWPSMEYFEMLRNKRRALLKKYVEEVGTIGKRRSKSDRNDEIGECPVFLSSVSFSKLDRSCISRLALFAPLPNAMPYASAPLHFKSICRLLRLDNDKSPTGSNKDISKMKREPSDVSTREYLSWFMLTSACLSKGAQGQPTPHRDPTSDRTSYSNFELGVLFCSRLVGDNKFDRLYVSEDDPDRGARGCWCGRGERMYHPRARAHTHASLLESVRKVRLPVPYRLRPAPYQEDPESDFMSRTPYMHEVPDGTGCVGNMKLTPFGQRVARDAEKGHGVP